MQRTGTAWDRTVESMPSLSTMPDQLMMVMFWSKKAEQQAEIETGKQAIYMNFVVIDKVTE